MPLPVITNTVRVATGGVVPGGAPWINTLHFRKTSGAIDATAINALHTELARLYSGTSYGGVGTRWLENCVAAVTWTRTVYTPLDGVSGSTVVSSAGAGASAGDSLPPQTCEVMTLRTATRGRRYRGRLYLPCFSETASSSAGSIIGSVAAAYESQGTQFMTALTAINWQWVVASYLGSFATTITAIQMDTVFDVQRRRKAP